MRFFSSFAAVLTLLPLLASAPKTSGTHHQGGDIYVNVITKTIPAKLDGVDVKTALPNLTKYDPLSKIVVGGGNKIVNFDNLERSDTVTGPVTLAEIDALVPPVLQRLGKAPPGLQRLEKAPPVPKDWKSTTGAPKTGKNNVKQVKSSTKVKSSTNGALCLVSTRQNVPNRGLTVYPASNQTGFHIDLVRIQSQNHHFEESEKVFLCEMPVRNLHRSVRKLLKGCLIQNKHLITLAQVGT
ncbi:hypothetical protein C8J56DRAFT_888080 [Mycena floridula]|nr:hypothetical protein C8J56DRAFT_888080 [Mycena floridula]